MDSIENRIPLELRRDIVLNSKISRGENYQGQPYLVLDCPNFYSKKDVLAFRVFIWWGNQVICSLHLMGKPLDRMPVVPAKFLDVLRQSDTYVHQLSSPWTHEISSKNHLPLSDISEQELVSLLRSLNYIKISRSIPIREINYLKFFSQESLDLFLDSLSS